MTKYKTFTAEALLAADVNDLLMRQVVIQVDNHTDRDTLIPAPEEGMLIYVTSTGAYESFDGADWAPLLPGGLPYVEFRLATPVTLGTGAETTVDLDGSPTVIDGVWTEAAGVVTMPRTGAIVITAQGIFESGGSPTLYQLRVFKNGTTLNVLSLYQPPATSRVLNGSTHLRVAAGDTLRLRAYHNAGANKTLGEVNSASPIFAIQYIS